MPLTYWIYLLGSQTYENNLTTDSLVILEIIIWLIIYYFIQLIGVYLSRNKQKIRNCTTQPSQKLLGIEVGFEIDKNETNRTNPHLDKTRLNVE